MAPGPIDEAGGRTVEPPRAHPWRRVPAPPEAAIARACRTLELMASAAGRRSPWLAHWEEVLAAGPERVLRVLTDADSPLAVELRQNSPFAGLLSEAERRLLLEAFRRVDARRAWTA